VPMVLDPSVAAVRMGLPEARPSAKIAKLFPQTPPSKDAAAHSPPTAAPPAAAASAPAQTDNKTAATGKPATASNQATPAPPTPQAATVGSAVPLPQAKPELLREKGRMQHRRRHRS